MEPGWFKSGHHHLGLTGELSIVDCLSVCRRDVSDVTEQSVIVEPGHPFQGVIAMENFSCQLQTRSEKMCLQEVIATTS